MPRFNPKSIIDKKIIDAFSFRKPDVDSLSNSLPSSSSSIERNIKNKRVMSIFNKLNKRIKNKKIKETGHPFNRNTTSSSIHKSNVVAKSLGFKNVADYDKFIKNINPNKLTGKETGQLSKLYRYLLKVAKKNPKSIAKLAIAGGTLTAMVIYLKQFQGNHSGCFRYKRKRFSIGEDKIRYKFAGSSWCNTTSSDGNDDDDDIKHISEREHPLYNQLKWDCNYSNFDKKNETVNDILSLGCNGLCDWRNFNILAQTTGGEYQRIVSDQLLNFDERFYAYNYKCETVSFLQALSTSTAETLNNLFTLSFGKIQVKRILFIFLFIFLIYIAYSSLKTMKKKKMYNNNNN